MPYNLNRLSAVGAPILMAMLLDAVSQRSYVIYGDVARKIASKLGVSKVFPTHIGSVAGSMMDRIIDVYGSSIPPINALVVDGVHHVPGIGIQYYLRQFGGAPADYNDLAWQEKQQVIRPFFHHVYSYSKWDEVAQNVFGVTAPIKIATEPGESDGKAKRAGFGGPAESPEHRSLKENIAKRTKEFGAASDVKKGICEFRLPAWDEVDVCFLSEQKVVMVEVKSKRSNDVDLKKGLYQCIKYVALLSAEDKVLGKRRSISCELAVGRKIPPAIRRYATKLGVVITRVDARGRPI